MTVNAFGKIESGRDVREIMVGKWLMLHLKRDLMEIGVSPYCSLLLLTGILA